MKSDAEFLQPQLINETNQIFPAVTRGFLQTRDGSQKHRLIPINDEFRGRSVATQRTAHMKAQ